MIFRQFNARSHQEKPQKAKALLVWELGAGFTHLQNMFGVARHLRSLDVECIIASSDLRLDAWFRSIGCQSLQGYLWPVMRYDMALPAQRKANILSDILVNFGLCEPNNLTGLLAHYTTLFDLVRPDILLCENAPGAALAARGRMPTLLFGSTLMMLPPQLEEGLAPIHAASPDPAWPADDVLDAVNQGLGSFAIPPLMSLRDLMDCAAVLPFGPAALDPYRANRSHPVLSPHCPDLPGPVADRQHSTVFVYLHEEVQHLKPVMDAVLALPRGARVYIQSLSREWAAALGERGLVVENRMLPLKDIAQMAGCLVHHGGVTLTAAAIAMAVPQVIIARSGENGIAGTYLVERGLGQMKSMKDVSSEWLSHAIAGVMASHEMREKVAAASHLHRQWFRDDPTYHVASKAAEILGLPKPRKLGPSGHQQWSPL